MNGENFKELIKDEFEITDFNIYLKLKDNTFKQLRYCLKDRKLVDKMKENIKKELEKFRDKNPKIFDTYKAKDEFLCLNINDIEKTTEFQKIKKEIFEFEQIIEIFNSETDKIKYLIIDVFINEERLCLLIPYNKYSSMLKKTFIGSLFNSEYEIYDTKNSIILSFSPESIIYKDEIVFSNTSSDILDLKEIFNQCIKENMEVLKNIFEIEEDTLTTKKQKLYLSRGIFNKDIEKYMNLSPEKKRFLIEKFKEKYKEKFKIDILINSQNEKINLKNLDSKEKEEIIKFVTNRSAFKVLDESLTTSID